MRAIEINPDYAEAYWNKATVLLELSDFEAGWPLYSWRWQNKELNLKKISTNNYYYVLVVSFGFYTNIIPLIR